MKMPHVEFEHYSQKGRKSYEKGNISDYMAKKELRPKNYEIYKQFKSFNDKKQGTTELEIDYTIQKPKSL